MTPNTFQGVTLGGSWPGSSTSAATSGRSSRGTSDEFISMSQQAGAPRGQQ